MFEKLGGRKMVGATVTMAVGIIAVLIKGDIPDNLLQLLEVVFGVFAGANSINTAAGLVLARKTAAEPQIQVDAALKAANDSFVHLNGNLEASTAQTQKALDEIIKSTQLTQNALSVIAERVLSK
jgi:hypothetical protein